MKTYKDYKHTLLVKQDKTKLDRQSNEKLEIRLGGTF